MSTDQTTDHLSEAVEAAMEAGRPAVEQLLDETSAREAPSPYSLSKAAVTAAAPFLTTYYEDKGRQATERLESERDDMLERAQTAERRLAASIKAEDAAEDKGRSEERERAKAVVTSSVKETLTVHADWRDGEGTAIYGNHAEAEELIARVLASLDSDQEAE